MKNIKKFQNSICNNQNLHYHIDKLIKAIENNNNNITVFFSGTISSLISTIISMMLVKTSWVGNVLVNIIIVVVFFIATWIIVAKWGFPLISKWSAQRRTTVIQNAQITEVISYFNTSIVLSALEIEDSISIVKNEGEKTKCREINSVVGVFEFAKCINYICNNIKPVHIRCISEKTDKLMCNYINQYTLTLVYRILYNAGENLIEYFNKNKSLVEDVDLILYDLEQASEKFLKHREELGIEGLLFENTQHDI